MKCHITVLFLLTASALSAPPIAMAGSFDGFTVVTQIRSCTLGYPYTVYWVGAQWTADALLCEDNENIYVASSDFGLGVSGGCQSCAVGFGGFVGGWDPASLFPQSYSVTAGGGIVLSGEGQHVSLLASYSAPICGSANPLTPAGSYTFRNIGCTPENYTPTNNGIELCGDGIDNDGNGLVDEGCSPEASETSESGGWDDVGCLEKTGSDPILLPSKSAATQPFTDFSVQFVSKLSITRTYNSNDWSLANGPIGMFGKGWHHDWEATLSCQADVCTVSRGLAPGQQFKQSGTAQSLDGSEAWSIYSPYVTNDWNGNSYNILARKPDGTWILFLTDGQSFYFQTVCDACSTAELSSPICLDATNGGAARLVKIVDPAGNSVTVNYNRPNGLFFGLYDDLGHALELRNTQACSIGLATELRFNGSTVATYSYVGQNLDRATDADGHILRSYTYDSNDLIQSVKDGGGQAIAEFSYDQAGRAIGLVDYGASVSVNYDASGGTAVTEYFHGPGGDTSNTSVRALNNDGRVTSVSDGCACGSAKMLTWTNRRLNCAIDSQGHVTNREFDTLGRLTRQAEYQSDSCGSTIPSGLPPDSRDERYAYGIIRTIADGVSLDLDIVTSTTKPDTVFAGGLVMDEIYDYSQDGNPEVDPSGYACTSTTLPEGSVVCRQFNSGYVYSTPTDVMFERRATFFSYDARGRLLHKYGPVSLSSPSPTDIPPIEERTYWGDTESMARRGRLHQIKRYASPTATPLVTSYDYDVFGVYQVTDERGSITTFIKDGRGRTIFAITADGQPHETRYYSDLKPRLQIAPSGAATRSTYDSKGRLQKIEQLSSDPEASGANPVLGWSEIYAYDAAGNRIHAERRDAQANLTWQQDRAFDVHHRVVWESNPENPASVRTVSYDTSGFLTGKTDEEGRGVLYTPDGIGRVTKVRKTGPSGQGLDIATYTYQANVDAMNAVTDGNSPSHTTGYVHDDFGQVAKVQPVPTSGAIFYAYDARGNVVRRGSPGDSEPVVYTYDGLDRLLTLSAPGLNYTYTYDAAPYQGRLTSIQEPDRTVSFTYDAVGRMTSETIHENDISTTLVTTYVYDADGAVAEITYPSGLHIQYSRDPATREVSQVTNVATGMRYADQVAHYPAGPTKSLIFGDGQTLTQTFNRRYEPVVISSGPLALTYTMSPAGDVSSISDSAVGYGFSELNYEYDGAGNRTLDTIDTVQANYTIIADRVTQRQVAGKSTHAYGYDGVGSLSAIEQYDTGGTTPTTVACLRHDSLGRMVLYGNKSDAFAAGATTCTLDSELSQPIARFKYDARNRRIARQNVATGQWTYIISDAGGRTLSELILVNETWMLLRDYVWLDGQPLAQIEYPGPAGSTDGYVYYYHLDHIGLPRALTNQAGQTIWSATATPYGDIVESTSTDPLSGRTVATNLRLPGQYDERLLGSLGLQGPYYNWNRWYLPSIGRYLEIEPLNLGTVSVLYPPHQMPNAFAERYLELLEQPQRNNPYTYALDNPLMYTDRNGENPGLIVLGAGVGAFCMARPNVCQAAMWAAAAGVAATLGAIAGYCDAKSRDSCSCVCYERGKGPSAIGQKPSAWACKEACNSMGYSGYKCGGDVTWN